MVKFSLTFVRKPFKSVKRLGDRIGVIRRVLAPLTEVRILVPQPKSILFQVIFNPFLGEKAKPGPLDLAFFTTGAAWRDNFMTYPHLVKPQK